MTLPLLLCHLASLTRELTSAIMVVTKFIDADIRIKILGTASRSALTSKCVFGYLCHLWVSWKSSQILHNPTNQPTDKQHENAMCRLKYVDVFASPQLAHRHCFFLSPLPATENPWPCLQVNNFPSYAAVMCWINKQAADCTAKTKARVSGNCPPFCSPG